MTEEEYNAYVGKLCRDMNDKDKLYMVYDMYYKPNHKGGMFPAYKYIALHTGHMGQAPCSHFFGAGAYVRFLSPSDF